MRLQNCHTVTSDRNRVMVHRLVILFTAMTGPQPSARATADPRTVRLAPELLERTAGRCRRCRSVIAENARKRGQAWSVCTPCAQAIKDETRARARTRTVPAMRGVPDRHHPPASRRPDLR